MRNRIIAGFTLLSFMGLTGFPVLASIPSAAAKGSVEASSGQVLYQTGAQGWRNLDGKELASGDVVRTGADGQAIVRFGNSRVRLSSNTEMRVVSLAGAKSELTLDRGRILGSAGDDLTINTAKTRTSATAGEFVLDTSDTGSALHVLSGDACLIAAGAGTAQSPGLAQVPDVVDQQVLAGIDSLSSIQSVGEVALLGEWKGKGKGIRRDDGDESVGGEIDASPDQDVPPPRQPDPPVVVQPPVTPPVVVTPPPVTPPVTPPPAAAAGGIGAWPFIALAVLGGGVAALVGGDDDNDNEFVPNNPGVPSPNLP